jgi:tetratricopeptide (TPR) repeat protein
MHRRGALVCLLMLTVVCVLSAQPSINRERARPFYQKGWEFMRIEAWPDAAKAFQEAIVRDVEYEDAYYGLGLASMRMKKYGDALTSYVKCRDLYQAQAGKRFTNRQEALRYRQDRLTELDEVIRQFQQTATTAATQERLRQLTEQRRQLQEYLTRGGNISIDQAVPGFVYLALGSAYFRTEQFADAEREYKAAIAADAKAGEAYNNLAVVFLQTGRFKEADDAVRAAEKAGFKAHPQLKLDIKARLEDGKGKLE